jgi:hypothetical protein
MPKLLLYSYFTVPSRSSDRETGQGVNHAVMGSIVWGSSIFWNANNARPYHNNFETRIGASCQWTELGSTARYDSK